MFILPTLWEARLKAESGWPIFLYHFDHVNPEVRSKAPFRMVNHGAEYPYTLGAHIFGKFEFGEEDFKLREVMIEAISNFVKSG